MLFAPCCNTSGELIVPLLKVKLVTFLPLRVKVIWLLLTILVVCALIFATLLVVLKGLAEGLVICTVGGFCTTTGSGWR